MFKFVQLTINDTHSTTFTLIDIEDCCITPVIYFQVSLVESGASTGKPHI